MAQYILEQIKLAGEMKDLIAVSNGENVKLNIDGQETTLAEQLSRIIIDISNLPTESDVNSAVSAAINDLIDGAPDTFDTLKEIAEYIGEHEEIVDFLNEAIGNKVSKEDGKGLSANDFTDAFKLKLESLTKVEASSVNGNIIVDGEETQVYEHPVGSGFAHIPEGGGEGQVLTKTASGYTFEDAPVGVHYGTAPQPEEMKDGELFIRVVE